MNVCLTQPRCAIGRIMLITGLANLFDTKS